MYRPVTGKCWHMASCSRLRVSTLDLLTRDARYIGEEQMCKICCPDTRKRRRCYVCSDTLAKSPPRPCQHNGGVLAYVSGDIPHSSRMKYVWPSQLQHSVWQRVRSTRTLVIDPPLR